MGAVLSSQVHGTPGNCYTCLFVFLQDVRVPVCPLCNQLVPVNRGEDPNAKVHPIPVPVLQLVYSHIMPPSFILQLSDRNWEANDSCNVSPLIKLSKAFIV